MKDAKGYILKILLLSAALSLLIKSTGPRLEVPATAVNALIAVFLPSLMLAGLLIGRQTNQKSL
ncbi:MAG: hypothetical protein ACRC8A_10595 [Microcoleaceae cyanobacterium]